MSKLTKRIVIFGVSLAPSKLLTLALTDIYGIGLKTSMRLTAELGISPRMNVADITEKHQYLLIKKIKDELRIEENLRDMVKSNIQRLIANGSRRGFCHRNHLPVRGQRTHTNAQTAKKVIMGMSKKSK
jgi:small subunit ribosomal protein S13